MNERFLIPVSMVLNGYVQKFKVTADTRLIDILRDELGLVSAKQGCSVGRCGACTVQMNGLPVNACLVMAWQVDGARVSTPEGFSESETAQVVRQVLAEENAFQCGYCAPGITMSLISLLEGDPQASEDDILKALTGHLCRCTGYQSIMRGALAASSALKGRAA